MVKLSSTMTERRAPNEVHKALMDLVRTITLSFYPVECQIIMEMMSYYRSITEDDMTDLLKFDKKQLRSFLKILQQDKFIKCRDMLLTGDDEKPAKVQIYYVDYGVLINVIKYKLFQVRSKIGTLELDSNSRTAFGCPGCQKTYTDLDVGQLFDALTQTLRCTWCCQELEENTSEDVDTCQMMALFNEQAAPIFSLLQTLDGMQLPAVLLEPQSNIKRVDSKNGNKIAWSGEATRSVVISKNEVVSISNSSGKPHKIKEVPSWIKSSISGIDKAEESDHEIVQVITNPSTKEIESVDKELVMKTLLSHERTTSVTGKEANAAKNCESEDEMSDDDNEFMVTIGSKKVPFNDITPGMVAGMTEAEKEEYIKVGREMHEYYE